MVKKELFKAWVDAISNGENHDYIGEITENLLEECCFFDGFVLESYFPIFWMWEDRRYEGSARLYIDERDQFITFSDVDDNTFDRLDAEDCVDGITLLDVWADLKPTGGNGCSDVTGVELL